MTPWPFDEPENILAFTSRDVVDLGKWIHYVSHDEDDGAWKFHSIGGAPKAKSDARLVLLKNIVERDPTVAELADLPCGWIAWRDTEEAEWQRRRR
jgi:hypothetical protein